MLVKGSKKSEGILFKFCPILKKINKITILKFSTNKELIRYANTNPESTNPKNECSYIFIFKVHQNRYPIKTQFREKIRNLFGI